MSKYKGGSEYDKSDYHSINCVIDGGASISMYKNKWGYNKRRGVLRNAWTQYEKK